MKRYSLLQVRLLKDLDAAKDEVKRMGYDSPAAFKKATTGDVKELVGKYAMGDEEDVVGTPVGKIKVVKKDAVGVTLIGQGGRDSLFFSEGNLYQDERGSLFMAEETLL